MTTRELISAQYGEDILLADGFDDAFIGVDYASERAVYAITKMVRILMVGGMNPEEAMEYLEFNVLSAYVGEKTPIYIYEVD